MTEYQKVCQEISLERPHVCSGCGTTQFLSHSHLIPRSYRKDLYIVKENIQLHCMSVGRKGCHEKFERVEAPLLNDFEDNMAIIMRLDETYFFKKFFNLMDYWQSKLESNPKDNDAILAVTRLYDFGRNKMNRYFDLSKK